jgi:hypothetical protein
MSHAASPLRDRELVQMLADEPELLAVADALVETQRTKPVSAAATDRRWKPLFAAALGTATLAGAGVAIAAGFGAFNGISAAQHPQTAADRLDPTVVQSINDTNALFERGSTGKLLPESSRFTRRLPTGERVYALTTTTDKLCVLILGDPASNMHYAVGCGDSLDQANPSTLESLRPDPALPALTFGVAIEGATSVSLAFQGADDTVPVENNVWAYEGPSTDLQSLTIHYTDGATQTFVPGQGWQPITPAA